MANFDVIEYGDDYLATEVSGLSSGYAATRRFTYYLDDVQVAVITMAPGPTYTNYTYRNLQPNTRYDLRVKIQRNSDGLFLDELTTYGYTLDNRPELWDWNTSNGSASYSQTRNAYNAITSQGRPSNFSYLVWNDIVDKLMEVLDWLGVGWSSQHLSYSATRMSSGDRTMTADRINSVIYNIGVNYNRFPLEDIYKRSDAVLGQYFITITNGINSIINLN